MTSLKTVFLVRWICRCILLGSTAAMTYIVLLPSYNFSHWIPHALIKRLGFSYEFQLWIDHNLDKLFHFGGAFTLLILLFGANLIFKSKPNSRLAISTALVAIAVFAAEYAQEYIGRGFSHIDIWFGLAGTILAILLIRFTFVGKLLSNTVTEHKKTKPTT